MENSNELRTTNGYFDIVGTIDILEDSFQMNKQSKNNENWFSNTMNVQVKANNNSSMYVRFSSGYDKVKGKTIYTMSKENSSLQVPFGDRNNKAMLDLVSDNSFIKVFYERKEVEEDGKKFKKWTSKDFIDVFDAVSFLQQIIPVGSTNFKIRATGRISWGTYNGEVQKNFDLQNLYILQGNEEEGKERPLQLGFTQNVLVKNGDVDYSKYDEDGVITVNANVLTKSKGVFSLLPLKLLLKANKEDAKKYSAIKKISDKFISINDDKVRRINLDCIFECGYVAGAVTYDELPDEAKELIEDGIYDLESIMNLYASKQFVNDLVISRPVIKKKKDELPKVDMSDSEYTIEMLENVGKADIDEEVIVEDDVAVDDVMALLNDLGN